MSGAETVSSRRWVSLAASCSAAGLVWLAFADLGVAIPTIAESFDADMSALQWANNAFSLTTGAFVIAAGRFGDSFGRRKVLIVGLTVFAACSAVCAVAPGTTALIAGRALMGIGAALILPATLALIPAQFSGREALTAFGIWQAVAWSGQAIGPAIGGAITDGPGWRWLFWLNIPVAIAAIVLLVRVTPESSDASASRRVDWPGLTTIGLAVFALLYALTDGPTVGWSDPLVIGLLVAAIILAVAWVLIEQRVQHPLVDLDLFRLRPYDGALTANFVMNLAFAGLSYTLVLWLQNVRGYSAVESGLLMLPSTVGIFALIPVGGRMDERRGGRMPVLLGLVVLAAGLAVLGFMTDDSSLALIGVGLVVIGAGLGLLSTPISNTAVGEVPDELAGTAAGVFKMSSMVGGAVGVALLAAITRTFTNRDSSDAVDAAGLTADDVDAARAALVNSGNFHDALSSLPADVAGRVVDAVTTAFTDGVADSMVATAILALAATAIVFFLWPRTGSPGAIDGAPASTSTTTDAG